jgi:hypothetical protein
MKTDPSLASTWIYLLRSRSGMWVDEFGYSCGAGTWMRAKHFSNIGDARRAIEDPSWHNDPAGVARCKPVKLRIHIEIELPKEKSNAQQEQG